MYVRVHMLVCVCMYMYAYVLVYRRISLPMGIYVHACACMHCVGICVFLFMYDCMCICFLWNIYINFTVYALEFGSFVKLYVKCVSVNVEISITKKFKLKYFIEYLFTHNFHLVICSFFFVYLRTLFIIHYFKNVKILSIH